MKGPIKQVEQVGTKRPGDNGTSRCSFYYAYQSIDSTWYTNEIVQCDPHFGKIYLVGFDFLKDDNFCFFRDSS